MASNVETSSGLYISGLSKLEWRLRRNWVCCCGFLSYRWAFPDQTKILGQKFRENATCVTTSISYNDKTLRWAFFSWKMLQFFSFLLWWYFVWSLFEKMMFSIPWLCFAMKNQIWNEKQTLTGNTKSGKSIFRPNKHFTCMSHSILSGTSTFVYLFYFYVAPNCALYCNSPKWYQKVISINILYKLFHD